MCVVSMASWPVGGFTSHGLFDCSVALLSGWQVGWLVGHGVHSDRLASAPNL